MRMLRRVPQLLRFIPGTAQDVRAYYLTMQYWLAGSSENIASLVRLLVDRYARGPRAALKGTLTVDPPVAYPEVGVYHPDLPGNGLADDAAALPVGGTAGRVGLLLMRSYLLSGNRAHYDAVIRALEGRGLSVVPAFAYGLDGRPAVDRFFKTADGHASIDALVSLTGFSLVGGPAYNDAAAAQATLAELDVPYLALQTLEFQSIAEWEGDQRGLNPLQVTLQVAVPELDGATGPLVFGGKGSAGDGQGGAESLPITERVERLAARVARLAVLRRSDVAGRKLAVVIFNFPPNAGNVGTAAYLAVFESLQRTLVALAARGYVVDVPADADELRERILGGNASRFGTAANVHARIAADDHVRRERYLDEIERTWGPAPGRQLTDGASLFVLGERFGNVFVGVQPAFGYEGDPMRLLFERGFAPTHAFSAFYRWVRDDFKADAVLHFGTHGALEFMPGKQAGLSAACWPDRLIGDLPNFYLYASNNPSEGTLAKRRGAATLVSYLTPPIANAGLYRGLLDLKATVDRFRAADPRAGERDRLLELVQTQAAALDLAAAEPPWSDARASGPAGAARVDELREKLLELEYSLIPDGLHVVGAPPSEEQRVETLLAMARSERADLGFPALPSGLYAGAASDETRAGAEEASRRAVAALARTRSAEAARRAIEESGFDGAAVGALFEHLGRIDRELARDNELPALVRALDGRYVSPAPGGDLLRNPAVLPTGRNVYGFDPYRVPSAFAMTEGRAQAERLLRRHVADGNPLPETVACVLWGTDNMKTEGGPLAQVLALMGAEPRFDALGRLAGARLVPLAQLGRPRVDVVVTVSGICRDLLPLQVRLIAEAALLAAGADEPAEENFVRKHALAHQRTLGCDLETAALRVFSNAEGAYGSNVNHLVENGQWTDEAELAETFVRRKSFAYGVRQQSVAMPALMKLALAGADLAYQNLDSVELGATDVDQYYESLGGMSRAMHRERGAAAPAYMGDLTGAEGKVRTLDEQVALEARTRMLNPRWYEGMLRSGFEGVRNIEAHVTNTLGWSATTGGVQPWIYRELSATYVLDPEMRERLARLNPHAAAKMAGRLLEAHDRGYWQPDDDALDALRDAAAELEDRLEGVFATA